MNSIYIIYSPTVFEMFALHNVRVVAKRKNSKSALYSLECNDEKSVCKRDYLQLPNKK